ncbi:hypothetical protein [Bradyrhizobium sp. CCBAU 51753]|uniref:hypothetical protein n=1 Tax=Bradyrhizobium sp. CCBAU 51753 TaxID=1325100 RepID=UPI001FEE6845|nr:hypothetical protein [Bradyrhizobium sp. CCBAU 51753]
MNDDSLDQLAQCGDELGLVEFRGLCGDVGQAPDVGEIALNRRRVHGDDLGSGCDLCELGLDALPFGGELIDFRVVGVEIRALRNVRDQAIDLAVELAVAALQMLLAVATLLGQAPPLGVVGADIFGDCLGIGELLAQAFKHQGLDSRARNLAAVAADAALAKCRALHAVRLPLPLRADRRHTCAAGSTAQQA